MHCGKEIAFGLVIAGGDSPELLEFGEEILDQMAGLEEVPVVLTLDRTVGPRGDDRCLARGGERLNNPFIGIICLVGKERIRLHVWQELIGPCQITFLSTSEEKGDRIAQCVNQSMDFCAQSAT